MIMTQSQKLEALVQRAIDGGLKWKGFNITSVKVNEFKRGHLPIYIDTDEIFIWSDDDEEHGEFNGVAISIESMLFNHDFARALFGEKNSIIENAHITRSIMPGYVSTLYPKHNSKDLLMEQTEDYKCFSCGRVLGCNNNILHQTCWRESEYNAGWQYHLQQAVISDDPISYMYEAVFDGS